MQRHVHDIFVEMADSALRISVLVDAFYAFCHQQRTTNLELLVLRLGRQNMPDFESVRILICVLLKFFSEENIAEGLVAV